MKTKRFGEFSYQVLSIGLVLTAMAIAAIAQTNVAQRTTNPLSGVPNGIRVRPPIVVRSSSTNAVDAAHALAVRVVTNKVTLIKPNDAIPSAIRGVIVPPVHQTEKPASPPAGQNLEEPSSFRGVSR